MKQQERFTGNLIKLFSIKNIPNCLTFLRIILITCIIILLEIGTKKQNQIYWQNVGLNKQYILGSQDIIDINNENIKHAEKYNYKIMDNENIIKILKKTL